VSIRPPFSAGLAVIALAVTATLAGWGGVAPSLDFGESDAEASERSRGPAASDFVPASFGEGAALASPSSPVPPTVARLQYGGGGDWYANPSSLPNLLEAIRTRTGIPVAAREGVVTPLDPALPDYPLVHMTGHGNVAFNAEERNGLRSYLEGGGFLHADDNYGMDEAFRREMERLYPDRPMVELPPEHPIFSAFYEFPEGLPKIHEHDGMPPQAFGIFHEGRLMVLYTYETDLGNGWEDPEVHDNPEDVREEALRMGVNIFVYALSQKAP